MLGRLNMAMDVHVTGLKSKYGCKNSNSNGYVWNFSWTRAMKSGLLIWIVLGYLVTVGQAVEICKYSILCFQYSMHAVVDLHRFWTPPSRLNFFFIFMQFSGKFGRIIGWRSLWEILDPPESQVATKQAARLIIHVTTSHQVAIVQAIWTMCTFSGPTHLTLHKAPACDAI